MTRSPRTRLVALGLVGACIIGGVATAPAQASAKTTNQRLQALERRLTVRARALSALQKDTERLVRAHNDLVAANDALSARYVALIGCVQRTPVYSWPGFLFDVDGGAIGATQTTTLTRWYNPGGVFPTTGVLSDATDRIHELALANTQACLASVAFRNPLSPAAAAGLGVVPSKEQKP